MVWTGSFACAQEKKPGTWDGPLLKPAARETVYEFSREPAVKKVGPDRYEISFTSKGKCDVAVAVEGPDGRILRHIVYGVLGSNAPEPLKKNSLEQTLSWNGKDDFGKYVKNPERCRVRVSLGLKATFDKLIGWHPKDIISSINGLGSDPEGVYLLTGGGYWAQMKKYDHDGNYARTLLPFPADKLKDLKDVPLTQVPGGEAVPIRGRFGAIAPYSHNGMAAGGYQILAVSQGRIAFTSTGRGNTLKQVVRIGTDGSTRGESPLGPMIGPGSTFSAGSEMAASPDGKWLYLTRLRSEAALQRRRPPGEGVQHAIFRMAWDAKGPLDIRNNVFIGEAVKPDSDNQHLNSPEGVACDGQGRVYVSDFGNNRVQVFSSEGKYLATIPVKWPRQIQVHQKTGDIYLMSFGPKLEAVSLVKFSALPNPREVVRLVLDKANLTAGAQHEQDHEQVHSGRAGFQPIFCLDSWAKPAKVWMVPAEDRVLIWADRGNKFELDHDFDREIRRDGYTPHAFNGYKMNRLAADPLRGHLYYVNSLSTTFLRCNPEAGKAWDKIKVPGTGWRSLDELTLGLDGLLYMRTPLYLGRFNPDKIETRKADSKSDANLEIPPSAEVPFDYGEKQSVAYGGKEPYLQGVLKLPAQIRGNGFDMGMAVAPNGNVLSICQNYQRNTDTFGVKGLTVPKLTDDRYRPAQFPGRLWNQGGLIWVWNKHGQVIGEDLVKSMHGASCGVKGDSQGNLYVGLSAHPLDRDGKFLLPRNDDAGPGALLKFPGGRVFGTWGNPVKLDQLPARPPEFEVMGKLWTQNLLWSYPGMSTMTITTNTCTCPASRFDTDAYGRSFVPESWRFSVGVVDTNGNPILHIGRYGNPDSGRGPDSPVKVPGDIAFSQCDYLCTVTDKWLYVNDTGNWRIVRIKLGYHAERRASVGRP